MSAPEVEFKFTIIKAKLALTVPVPEIRAVAELDKLFDIDMEGGELQDEKRNGEVGLALRESRDPAVYHAVPDGLTAPPFWGADSKNTRYWWVYVRTSV